jgi:hypothetical protein
MSRIKILLAGFAVLAAALVGVRALRVAGPASPASSGAGSTAPAAAPTSDGMLATAMAELGGNSGSADAGSGLKELRAELAVLPKDEAVALIRRFFRDGKDRATGLDFEIAGDGSLSAWPTFRTFLLDALLAIDPSAAAELGREVLARPTSADEWALALRNVARGGEPGADDEFLRRKTEELIGNPAWQAAPSIGYLNAFDVLVHVGATASTPLLSDLIQRKDRKDLAHAGFLTLDRLVQREPVTMLERLAADRELQNSRPEMVAQQFARADLRDPAQREIVKAWLLDPARSGTELEALAGIYPNNNRFVSNNLLTREAGQTGEDLAAHDLEALQTVTAWASDPAFQSVRPTLDRMVSRLEGFVGERQASASPAPAVPPPSPE